MRVPPALLILLTALAVLLTSTPARAQRDLYGLPGSFATQRRVYEERAREAAGLLLAAYQRAWAMGDAGALARMYDGRGALYAADGRSFQGRREIRRYYEEAIPSAAPPRATLADFRLSGDVAVLTVQVERDGVEHPSTHLLTVRRGYRTGDPWEIVSHNEGGEAAAALGDGEGFRFLARDVLTAVSARGVLPGPGWFLLRADSGHVNVGANFVDAPQVPDSVAAAVAPAVERFLAALPGQPRMEVAFRLNEPVLVLDRLVDLPPGRLRLPAVLNAAYLRFVTRVAVLGHPEAFETVDRHQGRLRVLVSDRGVPALVVVERWTGVTGLDRWLPLYGLALRLEPARLGDQTFPFWITVPVVFAPER
jgi:ketosteroid isomerase-like protein